MLSIYGSADYPAARPRYSASMMSQREKHFERVEEIKAHIRDVPTEELEKRYHSGYLGKEGAIATREVLAERGEAHRLGH